MGDLTIPDPSTPRRRRAHLARLLLVAVPVTGLVAGGMALSVRTNSALTTASSTYVAACGDVLEVGATVRGKNIGCGGGGFAVTPNTTMSASIVDNVKKHNVNGILEFCASNVCNKAVAPLQAICGGSITAGVPSNATFVFILVPEVGLLNRKLLCGHANGATLGTITVND